MIMAHTLIIFVIIDTALPLHAQILALETAQQAMLATMILRAVLSVELIMATGPGQTGTGTARTVLALL